MQPSSTVCTILSLILFGLFIVGKTDANNSSITNKGENRTLLHEEKQNPEKISVPLETEKKQQQSKMDVENTRNILEKLSAIFARDDSPDAAGRRHLGVAGNPENLKNGVGNQDGAQSDSSENSRAARLLAQLYSLSFGDRFRRSIWEYLLPSVRQRIEGYYNDGIITDVGTGNPETGKQNNSSDGSVQVNNENDWKILVQDFSGTENLSKELKRFIDDSVESALRRDPRNGFPRNSPYLIPTANSSRSEVFSNYSDNVSSDGSVEEEAVSLEKPTNIQITVQPNQSRDTAQDNTETLAKSSTRTLLVQNNEERLVQDHLAQKNTGIVVESSTGTAVPNGTDFIVRSSTSVLGNTTGNAFLYSLEIVAQNSTGSVEEAVTAPKVQKANVTALEVQETNGTVHGAEKTRGTAHEIRKTNTTRLKAQEVNGTVHEVQKTTGATYEVQKTVTMPEAQETNGTTLEVQKTAGTVFEMQETNDTVLYIQKANDTILKVQKATETVVNSTATDMLQNYSLSKMKSISEQSRITPKNVTISATSLLDNGTSTFVHSLASVLKPPYPIFKKGQSENYETEDYYEEYYYEESDQAATSTLESEKEPEAITTATMHATEFTKFATTKALGIDADEENDDDDEAVEEVSILVHGTKEVIIPALTSLEHEEKPITAAEGIEHLKKLKSENEETKPKALKFKKGVEESEKDDDKKSQDESKKDEPKGNFAGAHHFQPFIMIYSAILMKSLMI